MKILFVCTGNICRSPTADGVMRHVVEQAELDYIEIDSAGTHAYHVGEAPDSRTQAAAEKRSYDLSMLRARQVQPQDYTGFDYVLAMDHSHLRWLEQNRPSNMTAKIEMFMPQDVPDPYYGDEQGFERVLDQIEAGVKIWVERLR